VTFTILGSSSGMPQAERACAGYLLQVGESLSLIDCGGGVTSSFLKCGYDPLAVERIFISHTHPDHCCELAQFIQMIYLAGRMAPLDVYVPEEFVEPLKIYLKAVYLIPEELPLELNVIGYTDGYRYEGDFILEALGNHHLSGYSEIIEQLDLPNKMQCHCFRIEAGGSRMIYSADIKDFDDIKPYLSGLNLAVIESTHVDLDAFYEFVPGSDVEGYVLTHLGSVEEVQQIDQDLSKRGLTNVVLAEDGLVVEL